MNNWEKFEKNLAELKANPDMDKVDILLEEINIYRFELEAQNEELKRTNMILYESQRKYEDLFNSIPISNILIDSDLKIKLYNIQTVILLQAERFTLKGEDFTKFISPDFQDAFYFSINGLDENNPSVSMELFLTAYLGRKIPSTASIRLSKDINGNIEYIISLIDQTNRRKLELELIESKSIYDSLASTLPFGIIRTDKNSVILDSNKFFSELFHSDYSSIIGKPIREIVSNDIADRIESNNAFILRTGKTITEISDYFDPLTRERKYLEIIEIPILDLLGNVSGIQILIKDVSEFKKSEQVLKDSEYKFRKLVEDSSDLFLISDGNANFFYVGANSESITGYSPEEALKLKIYDHIHNDYQDIIKNAYMESFNNKGMTISTEGVFRHKDGTWKWLELKITNCMDDPLIKGIITNIRDISDKKETWKIITEAENRYRTLFEFLPNGLLLIDPKTKKAIDFNNAAYINLGYSAEEFASMTINQYDIVETEEVTRKRIKKIIETGGDDFETRHRRKDGSSVEVLVKVRSININSQTLMMVMYQDISELRAILKEKEESELKFQAVVENALDGIYLLKGKHFIYVNDAISRITGYTRDEILSQEFDVDRLLIGNSKDFVNERIQMRESGSENSNNYEVEIINKENEKRIIDISTKTYTLNDVVLSIGIMRDITERKLIENELKSAKDAALKSVEITNTILNNLGHELRTPLNGILGFTKILMMELDDPELLEMTKLITFSGQRLKRTLEALLTLSEIESDKYNLILDQVNLTHFLSMYDNFTIDLLQDKPIEYSLDLSEEDIVISSDEFMLHQILYNILDNSYKFTDNGFVKMKLSKEFVENKNKAIIEICDSGIGIEEDKIEVIFLPFRQGSEGVSRKFEGIGLGLTIVQKIIQKLNGKLEIFSEVGKGTNIRLLFDCE